MVCCPETHFPLGRSVHISQCDIWKHTHNRLHHHPGSNLLSPWKTVLQRLSYVEPGFFGFFLPLWTVSCWRHIEFQMFPEECILLAVLSAVGQHVSQSIPKLALIPATFNRLWLFLPFLSLAGQNQSSMGRLTAGMLSVQFPPPRQNCDLLGVSFSVVWPLT